MPIFQSGHVMALLFRPDQALFEFGEVLIAELKRWSDARATEYESHHATSQQSGDRWSEDTPHPHHTSAIGVAM
jgi:hypothetical protein